MNIWQMMCWDGEQVDGWCPIHHLSTNQSFLSNLISIYYTNIHYVVRNMFLTIFKIKNAVGKWLGIMSYELGVRRWKCLFR